MRWLAVERSSGVPGMAVFEDGRLVVRHAWAGEPSRAPAWLLELTETLSSHRLSVADMDAFVCGIGPGSFSGIRAALSALQGLALPTGAPLYGVASAAALALGQAEKGGLVTVVGDARRERLWCVTYRVDPATARVCLADGRPPTHTADDFSLVPAACLAEAVPDGTVLVSSDWARLGATLSAQFAADRLTPRAVFPTADDVGRLALSAPESRVLEPLPIYLHPAVAEKQA